MYFCQTVSRHFPLDTVCSTQPSAVSTSHKCFILKETPNHCLDVVLTNEYFCLCSGWKCAGGICFPLEGSKLFRKQNGSQIWLPNCIIRLCELHSYLIKSAPKYLLYQPCAKWCIIQSFLISQDSYFSGRLEE